MPNYAFEVDLRAVIRVQAKSLKEARQILLKMESCGVENGRIEDTQNNQYFTRHQLTEFTVQDTPSPELFEEVEGGQIVWSRDAGQWRTDCPKCGKQHSLIVTEVTIAALGVKDQSTEDEKVKCSHCGAVFALEDLTNQREEA